MSTEWAGTGAASRFLSGPLHGKLAGASIARPFPTTVKTFPAWEPKRELEFADRGCGGFDAGEWCGDSDGGTVSECSFATAGNRRLSGRFSQVMILGRISLRPEARSEYEDSGNNIECTGQH
jgi:hypothetical protein